MSSPAQLVSHEERAEKMYTFVGILLAMFLGALDQTIVATALPRIVQDLNGVSRYAWVATSYLLVSTVLLPIYGKLADNHSRRKIELFAVSIFLTGSFLCGASGELGTLPVLGDAMSQLIIFRGLQGLGSAGLFAMAFIIIADLFPPAERGRYQGFVGSTFGLASVVGPLLGGLLTDHATGWIPGVAGWRWVFYVNLPIGAVALWFLVSKMPKLEPKGHRVGLNWLSALLLVAAVVPLILALELDKDTWGWGSPLILSLFGAFVVMLVLFIWHSRVDENPILDLGLFRNRVFGVSNLSLFLFGGGFLSTVIFLPLFMVNVLGVSATGAGVAIIPLSVGLVTGSVVSGQLVSRIGHYKPFMLGGGVIFLAGAILLSTMKVGIPYWQVTIYMVICGIGIGPTMPLFPLAIQNAVDVRKIGQATSASQFFRQIGGTVSLAIMGAVLGLSLTAQFKANMPSDLPQGSLVQAGGGQSRFNATGPQGIRTQISDQFNKVYGLIEAAFKGNDQSAIRKLENDPLVPAQYKQQLSKGTPSQQIQQQFDRRFQQLAADIRTDNAQGIRQSLQGTGIPDWDLANIINVAGSGNKTDIEKLIQSGKMMFDEQAKQAEEKATAQALSTIHKALDTQATSIADKVVHAVEQSFAAAITRIYFYLIFIIAAAVGVTLFIPELPLRKTFVPEAPRSPE